MGSRELSGSEKNKQTNNHLRESYIKFQANRHHNIFLCLKNYFTVVQLQLSAFSPHPSHTHLPLASLLLGFVPVSLTVVPENPSTIFHERYKVNIE